MSLISCLLNQECTVVPFIREGAGEPIYGDPEVRRCRLQTGGNLKNTGGGANGTILQVPAHAKLFMEGDYIPNKSRVLLDGQDYNVINCRVCRTMSNHHIEVLLE